MKSAIIIGSGAVAAELCSYIHDINKITGHVIEIFGFLDDNEDNFKKNAIRYHFTQPYLGKINDWEFKDEHFYIFGFANLSDRARLINKLTKYPIRWLTIVHPSTQLAQTSIIGEGTVIYPNCVIGPNVKIGRFNLITSFSFISHDCEVGDNNFLSTSGLSGNVYVGDNNFFGIRSTIIPSIKIGSQNTIQAGMTIDKDIADNETVFYRFKEKVSIIKSTI